MARPEEKARSMLNKWIAAKHDAVSGLGRGHHRKRPHIASSVRDLNEADRWRGDVLREIGAKVQEIQNQAMPEARVRELNDEINRLLRVKHQWEKQIKALGGPSYGAVAGGKGGGGGGPQYRYFGAAKRLPGVKELFDKPEPKRARLGRRELVSRADTEYYGFRDEEDGVLLRAEREADIAAGRTPFSEGENASEGFAAYVPLPSDRDIERAIVDRKKAALMARLQRTTRP